MTTATPTPPPLETSPIAHAKIRALGLTWGLDQLDGARRAAIVADVAAATGADEAECRRALDDEIRLRPLAGANTAERRVFDAHFGATATSLLEARDDTCALLGDFAEVFGEEAALLLARLLLAIPVTRDEREDRVAATLDALTLDPVLVATLRHLRPGVDSPPLSIAGKQAFIGSASSCEVLLPDPRIEAIHAELLRSEGGWRVVSRGERATVLDGSPVASAPVPAGSSLQIGPYRLRLDGRQVHLEPTSEPFALDVRGVRRTTPDRVLLDGVSFTALAGEVIALLGPSGSGKSTLVGALSGGAPADEGEILLDGEPIEAARARAPTIVGEVPQDDIVLPELTVEESLLFAARIRLPLDTTEADRQAAVNRALVELGMETVRGRRIGDPERRGISGGQRKRVNVGQEIVSDATRVLFLDEPTSGLDPRSAADIARLARRLADAGRIVVLVTHDLSAAVMAQVDHLLVLAGEGKVAWFGPPDEACAMFEVSSPAQIFERLAAEPAAALEAAYAASPAARRWVRMRSRVVRAGLLSQAGLPVRAAPHPGRIELLRALFARNVLVKRRDRAGLFVLTLQPLLLAAVMHLVFPRPTASLIFLLTLSSIWFGMSAAVRELIADRTVWLRERRIGVGVTAWVGSKILVLGVLVAMQCLALTVLVFPGSGLGPLGYSPIELVQATLLAGWSGLATGLLVSALWGRSEAAVGTIVLLLVPEIAFSGVMMPLQELGLVARGISWLNPARYAFHLLLRAGDQLMYLNTLGEWKLRPVSGELYTMGLRPPAPDSLGLAAGVLMGVLAAMIVVQLALAGALHRRLPGRRRPRAPEAAAGAAVR